MLNKAEQALLHKDYHSASALYREAFTSGEDRLAALQGLCMSLYYLHDNAGAEEQARLALAEDPDLLVPHRILAYIAARRGQLEQAWNEINAALHTAPDDWESLAFAGGLSLNQDRLDDARGMLQRSLALHPDYWLLHYNLGILLQREGNVRRSMSEYWRAFQLKPSWPSIRLWLGTVALRFRYIITIMLFLSILGAFAYRSVALLVVGAVPCVLVGLDLVLRKERRGWVPFLVGLLILAAFLLVTK